MKYDVLIAGGGSAGLFAAYKIAKAGFSVAIIEIKPADRIGEKVCGDAVGEHHFHYVKLEPPRIGVDAVGIFEGVRVLSPNEKNYITAWGKGYALNRKAFGQRLLKMAIDAGAELYDSHYIIKPVVEESWVRGLVVKKPSRGIVELKSTAVIDATGVAANIRRRLPSSWWVAERISPEDFCAAYRVIARVEEPQNPRLALIYLNPNVAPGGYWWWFPKGKYEINIGIGVKSGPGAPDVRRQFNKYILPRLEKANPEIIHEGGGVAPTRRPIPCMVWNGLLVSGDAAMTANPIHGGGIGPSLVSSYHAAEVLVKALENGDPSIDLLWPYHRAYHRAYGAKQASLDVLRIYLQSLSSEDLDFIIEKKIVTDKELSEMGYRGELLPTIISKATRALRLLTRPSLLLEIKAIKEYMDRARALYENYPETPDGFEKWRLRDKTLFKEVKSRFWK